MAALRRFYNAKGVKPTLLGVLLFLVSLIIFLQVERVRGQKAWADYQAQAKAKGNWIEFAAIKQAPVPEELNFAASPLIKSFSAADTDSAGAYARDVQTQFKLSFPNDLVPNGQGDYGDWQMAQTVDLTIWRAHWGTKDLLETLRKFDAVAADWAVAVRRPEMQFPLEGTPGAEDFNQLLINIRALTCLMEFRVLAELDAGQAGPAAADLTTLLRGAQHLAAAQSINPQMLAMEMEAGAVAALWQGLAARKWDETQLAGLEKELGALDPMGTSRQGFQFEAAFLTAAFEQLQGGPALLPADNGMLTGLEYISSRIPRGWLYQSVTGFRRYYDEGILACFEVERHRLAPAAVDKVRHMEEDIVASWSPDKLLLKTVPEMDSALTHIAQGQVALDEARVAVALERARLAAGKFPETLAELAPKYLAAVPPDLITGEPLHYRITADGDKFVLYSVGWNGKDDGGWTAAQIQARWSEGDWVWAYEAQKEIKK